LETSGYSREVLNRLQKSDKYIVPITKDNWRRALETVPGFVMNAKYTNHHRIWKWVVRIGVPPLVAFIVNHEDEVVDKAEVEALLRTGTAREAPPAPSGVALQVQHVYAINFWDDAAPTWEHPRFSRLPIGVSDRSKPADRHQLRCDTPPFEAKLPLAYADFHFNKWKLRFYRSGWEPRSQAVEMLKDNPGVVFASRRQRFPGLHAALTQYAFVISPNGRGPDCHRTWEAMWARSVPIVVTSPLDKLYEGFPVRIVHTWTDVNTTALAVWKEEYKSVDWAAVHRRMSLRQFLKRILADVGLNTSSVAALRDAQVMGKVE
jgi:hypothetical protein